MRLSHYVALACVFGSTSFFGVWVANTLKAEVSMSQEDSKKLKAYELEAKRDDELFTIMLGEWDRRATVKSTAVTVTCYNSTVAQCDSTPHITADGTNVMVGQIAVSPDMISQVGLKYGQRVFLAGYGLFEVRDVMSSRWMRRVDIWLSDQEAARRHGVKTTTMLWQ